MQGAGVPCGTGDVVRANLAARCLGAHDGPDRLFARLAGRKVAVVGAGASAFDNAATRRWRPGPGSVDLLFRRAELPTVNSIRFVRWKAEALLS